MAAPKLVVRVAGTLDELKKNLAEGKAQIEITQAQLAKMSASYDGSRNIQQANATAAAIQQIGGAAKLTSDEQAKASRIIEAGLEKYRALSREVPPGMEALAASLKPVEKNATLADRAAELLTGKVAQLAAAFTIGALIDRAAGALADWTIRAFTGSAALVDMSAKTGNSTEQLQRWAFVARQGSATVEDFAKASFNLGVRLSGGNGSVRAAVEDLGLSYDALKAKSPDEKFNIITGALERMLDPQTRNRLAVELFGKSAEVILPAIAGGYSKISKEAVVAGDAQVQALARAANHFDAAMANAEARFKAGFAYLFLGWSVAAVEAAQKQAAAIGDIQLGTESYTAQLDKARAAVAGLSDEQVAEIEAAVKMGKGQEEIANKLGVTEGMLRLINEATQKHREEQTKIADADKRFAEAMAELNSVGVGWKGTLETIDGEVHEAIRFYLDAGVAQDKLATAYGLTAAQVKSVASELQSEKEAATKAAEAQRDAQRVTDQSIVETTKLWDQYFALRVQRGGSAVASQLAQIERWFDDEVAKLKASDQNWTAHYEAIQAVAAEQRDAELRAINEHTRLSRTALEGQAHDAEMAYEFMASHSDDYTARAIRNAFEEAQEKRQAAALWRDTINAAYDDVDKRAEASAKKQRDLVAQVAQSFSITYDLTTQAGVDYYHKLNPAATFKLSDAQIIEFAQKGGTLQQLIQQGVINPYGKFGGVQGNMPLLADGVVNFSGGRAIVGERGPEIVNLPRGADVLPNGMGLAPTVNLAAGAVVINYPIMNDPRAKNELAAVVGDAIMQRLIAAGLRLPTGA